MITKSSYDLRIGADVVCQDGQCGKLLKVVVDPEQGQISDLIVEKGFLLKEDRIIPLGMVEKTTPEEIQLSLTSEELEAFEPYQEFAFEMISPEEGEDFSEGDVVMYSPMITPYGSVAGPFLPAVRRLVQDGLEEDQQVIKRGTPVANREQQLGVVDHVLVDRDTGRIGHLVLDPEALDHAVILPFSEVEELQRDQVVVNIPAGQLDELPRYRPPEETAVVEKLNALFEEQAPDFKGLEAALQEGIVKLSGVVPGISDKRRAESEVRSLAGVVDVDNQLETDTAIAARVTAALADDPDTSLADIQVVSDRGVVGLSGKADSEAVRDLAETLTEDQPGVVEVINEIKVEPDRYTANLPGEPEGSQGSQDRQQGP
jgi:uncharacterized protein YrrD